MSSFWGNRYFHPVLAMVLLIPACPALAQKSGSAASTPGASGTTNAGVNGSLNTTTNTNRTNPFPGSTNQSGTQQQTQSPIFLSGRVMLDNGVQPDRDIRIERVCNGSPHVEGHTDSKGRFSLQLGQNLGAEMDASDSSPNGYGRNSSVGGFGQSTGGFGGNSNSLWNCELRASYPGYSSDVVQLANRHALDSPDVGTIVLHYLGNVQGTTISVTTALAPKNARKEYEKGLQLAQHGKFEEAMDRFASATDLYPKYAIAWYALGQLQQKQGHLSDARSSYQKASTSDTHYVSPYNQLAQLAAQEGKWEDAANFSKQAISLNRVEFPSSFWFNALANYNLKRPADAEQSTKDLLKLDTQHHFPDAENLMAQLLLDEGHYPEAATHLRSYLTLVPNAKNADVLKQMLLKIDAAQVKAPPAVTAGKP